MTDAAAADRPSLTRFGGHEIVRAAEITAVLAAWIAWAVIRQLPRSKAALARAASAGAVEAFMVLGPTFVKLGQLIASSPGVFPAPLADACLRTLDDVPPFPAQQARAIIEEDLGAATSDLFGRFDPVPLSAASIAQVHACVLADGRDAVVKVQRPAIARRMNRDLRIMFRFARLIDRTRQGHLMNAPGVVEELHQVSNEELDFALEAERQTRFRNHIAEFGDNKWVTAPEVYAELCGPRVICMERMFGTPMDSFDELRRRGIDGELVLRRGVKVWMEAVLIHGPFHGDVHAGNLWVLEDGRAAYLDFGIMGELPRMHREALRDAQFTTMIDGDYTRIVRAWQRIGLFDDDVGPIDDVAARLRSVLEPMLDLRLGEASLAEMLHQQLQLQREFNVRAARELVLVTKQLMYFERYSKELAPDYNMGRDLFLLQNVFPEDVARLRDQRGLVLPDDSIPNVRRP
ncbi:MAG: ABC1 kinase family protein [Acidimicrobiales bacterium]